MHTPEAAEALRWLGERGVTRLPSGQWRQPTSSGDVAVNNGDLAHKWAAEILADDLLTPMQNLRTALGLLDLLDEFWVTVEIGWFLAEQHDSGLTDAFWAGYRQRLETPEPCEQVLYSLWVDWFEGRDTAEAAFSAVVGNDVRRLRAGSNLRELAVGPLHRRTARVLECSGPVPWAHKHDVYEIVAAVPDLQPALFRGLLTSYHDIYGDLEPAAALELLQRLDLPAETEHLSVLHKVLRTGARNHYHDKALWAALSDG